MKVIYYLIKKEFKQVSRNKMLLPLIFVTPLFQLLIMPLAANFEIKNINIAIVDNDHSTYSYKLTSKILSSGYFVLQGETLNYEDGYKLLEKDEADIVLEIPDNFERDLVREGKQNLLVAVNAINGVKANIGGAYLTQIISEFNSDIRMQFMPSLLKNAVPIITSNYSMWYNKYMAYAIYMVPGILAVMVTLICSFLSALNIVKEKEDGTIEQINVTPIKKTEFIIGKLFPYWIIGLGLFTASLFGIAYMVYGIFPMGNIFMLYCYLFIYLIAILGFGLLISTISETQQQAMSVVYFFIMVFLMMGGVFTSLDSMPQWAQIVSKMGPVSYFIEVMRMVVLKGSDWADLWFHFLIIILFAIGLNFLAIRNYKKTV